MKQTHPRRSGRTLVAAPEAPPDPLRLIRQLIWLYFWLLIIEGSLRKWVVPSLSNALLVVRDPVVVAIYAAALLKNRFPSNNYITAILVLAPLSFIVSLFVERANLFVNIFGFHCNFLHLPLIFVIGRVFTLEDVKAVGRWTMLLAVPMAGLLVAQFQSPPDNPLNVGAGEDAFMINAVDGRVRPSGTFSFILGVVFFYAQTAAFLIYGLVERKAYPLWLLLAAGLATPLALSVSGSRSALAAVAVVVAAYGVVLLLRPQMLLKSTKLIILAAVVAMVASSVPVVQEGVELLIIRIYQAGEVEADRGGFVGRFIRGFTDPLLYMMHVPLLGDGQGMGTNVGLSLMGVRAGDWREGEWERIIYESGPFLGLLYLIMRVSLVIDLAQRAARAARAGYSLPFLLMGACGVQLLVGQFAQATSLGFAVFGGGLVVAALNGTPGSMNAPAAPPRSRRRVPEAVRAQWAAARARLQAARPRPPGPPQPKGQS